MANCGFELVSEDLMKTAFIIAEQSGRPHCFWNEMAGQGWLEVFRRSEPQISLYTPQVLSYSRTTSMGKNIVDNFFVKLG